jgi:hypothetical protein
MTRQIYAPATAQHLAEKVTELRIKDQGIKLNSGRGHPSNWLQRRPAPRAPEQLIPSAVAATASASSPASAMVSTSRILECRNPWPDPLDELCQPSEE